MPERIAQILPILRILLEYGRHLAATLETRAAIRGFSIIAQCFGTARLPVILAHLHRGIMRAVVLQQVLLERAARGRDLVIPGSRPPPARHTPTPPPPDAAHDAVPPQQSAPRRRIRRANADAPLDLNHLPSIEEIEAEIHRRPLGRTLADILHDLGVAPRLCGDVWDDIMLALLRYRGNMGAYMQEVRRREAALDKELDRDPKLGDRLGWPEDGRDAVRRVLGFFLGDKPILPSAALPGFPSLAAEATGPP